MKLFFHSNPVLSSLKTFFQSSDVEIKTGILFVNKKSTWINSRVISAFYLANGGYIVSNELDI